MPVKHNIDVCFKKIYIYSSSIEMKENAKKSMHKYSYLIAILNKQL